MSVYRMYFRSGGRINGRDDFETYDDVAAIRIARVLFNTCSDVCDSFELWQGTRQIPARQAHHHKANLADLIEAHQHVVVEREECISRSRWRISESRRLIRSLNNLRSGGGGQMRFSNLGLSTSHNKPSVSH